MVSRLDTRPTPIASSEATQPSHVRDDASWKELVQLSRRTNELQRKLQQAQCNQSVGATDTGSWCRNAVQTQHVTDVKLAASLSELFAGKSVLSLGDGRGEYKPLLLNFSTLLNSTVRLLLCLLSCLLATCTYTQTVVHI